MKKISFIALLLVFLFSSCSDNSMYVIQGEVLATEYDGHYIYLINYSQGYSDLQVIDSVKIENGKFGFEGIVLQPEVYYLAFETPDRAEMIYNIILEPGQIKASFVNDAFVISGTSLNNQWEKIREKLNENNELLMNLMKRDSLSVEQIEKFKSLRSENSEMVYDFIKSNINNKVGESFLMPFRSQLSEEQAKELLPKVSAEFRSLKKIQDLEIRLAAENNVRVGNSFIDVEALSPDGKRVFLSDYIGKGNIVLVDFWASWCGPCIDDIPKVKMAYEKYKDRGFKVIGVSLDNDNDKWNAAIKRLNIEWPQLSDLKGWDSEFVRKYPARPIPYTILFDGEGKVIETGLRGNMLSSTLSRIYK